MHIRRKSARYRGLLFIVGFVVDVVGGVVALLFSVTDFDFLTLGGATYARWSPPTRLWYWRQISKIVFEKTRSQRVLFWVDGVGCDQSVYWAKSTVRLRGRDSKNRALIFVVTATLL